MKLRLGDVQYIREPLGDDLRRAITQQDFQGERLRDRPDLESGSGW